MSIHVRKSEKGVISSLFQDNLPEIHVWSDFQNVTSYQKSKRSSKCTFMLETRDPQAHNSLKFRCATIEEKDKWVSAIDEQLKLTCKMWSSQPAIRVVNDKNVISKLPKIKPTKYSAERQVVPVSVLDKWLEQLNFIDTAECRARNYRRGSGCSETSNTKRNNKRDSNCSEASNSKRNNRRGSSPRSLVEKTEHRFTTKSKRMQNIIEYC